MLDAVLYALIVGLAVNYIGAFAVELGHGPSALGSLATLPLLAGAAAQLSSVLGRRRWGSRKRVCVLGGLAQAASLTALVAVAAGHNPSFSVLLLATLGMSISVGWIEPAWHSWMAELTSSVDRSRYFARRSILFHASLLVSSGWSGWALERAGGWRLDCYALLFAVALLGRLGSVLTLAIQPEVGSCALPCSARVTGRRLIGAVRGRAQVPMYLALLALGHEVAAPFFTPYLLREVSLDYRTYASLAMLSTLAKGLTFLVCRSLVARLGPHGLLRGAGIGAALLPVFWAGSQSLAILALVNVLTGATWALVDHAGYQAMLDATPLELTAEVFALSSALSGVAQLLGGLIGGLLLERQWLEYQGVFLLSALLCGVALAPLVPLVGSTLPGLRQRAGRRRPATLTAPSGAGSS